MDVDAKIEELREVTRAANETLKDLKAERKEVEKLVGEYHEYIDKEIYSAVKQQIAHMTEVTGRAIDDATARVNRRFDLLGDILLGEDRKGRRKGTLEDLVREWMER